jgi:hypothetical protein
MQRFWNSPIGEDSIDQPHGLNARRFWNQRITAAHVKDPCTPHRALLLGVRQGAEEAACQILGSANQKAVFQPGRYTF